jgi:catalase
MEPTNSDYRRCPHQWNDNNSLTGEETFLLEDFILREKITHFDHERIEE